MTTPSKAAIEAAKKVVLLPVMIRNSPGMYSAAWDEKEVAQIIQSLLDAETAGLRGRLDNAAGFIREHQERTWAAEARADRAVELARKLHILLKEYGYYSTYGAQGRDFGHKQFTCRVCSQRWVEGEGSERHTPTCLASPEAIKDLEGR